MIDKLWENAIQKQWEANCELHRLVLYLSEQLGQHRIWLNQAAAVIKQMQEQQKPATEPAQEPQGPPPTVN